MPIRIPLVLVAALVLGPTRLEGAVAFVQAASASGNTASLNLTLGGTGTTNNLLVCVTRTSGGTDVTNVTYGGVALTPALEINNPSDTQAEQWYGVLGSASTAVVVTAASSGLIRAVCAEFSGIVTSSPYCACGQTTQADAATSTTMNVGVANAGDLAVTGIASSVDATFTDPTGYTRPSYSAVTRIALAYKITTTTAGETADWSFASANIAGTHAVYVADSGGGGGGGACASGMLLLRAGCGG